MSDLIPHLEIERYVARENTRYIARNHNTYINHMLNLRDPRDLEIEVKLRVLHNEWAWRVSRFISVYKAYKLIWNNWYTETQKNNWNRNRNAKLSVSDWEKTATGCDYIRFTAYLDLIELLNGKSSARHLISFALENSDIDYFAWWLQRISEITTNKALDLEFEPSIFFLEKEDQVQVQLWKEQAMNILLMKKMVLFTN